MSTEIQKKPMVTEPKKPMIPKFEIPKWCSDRISNEDDYLRHSTYAGTVFRYPELTEEIEKRINYESEIIKSKELSGYFLMIQEIIQAARTMGIHVGNGRGAAVGSVVNYCLGITGIDPLKFDLLFERFLNSETTTPPNFQLEFEAGGQEMVFQWLIKKYGEERVKRHHEKGNPHPTGVFIDSIRLDFLGLNSLAKIKETLSNISKSKNMGVDTSMIPLDHAKTFELFRNGDTEGVFQFESEEMQTLLRQLKPNNFEDLIALHTLFRRGNMDVYTFIISKCSDVAIYYDFPEMESRLKDTEGLYVYQEQIMLLSQDLAGFTPSQSDELRKALGEKDIEKLSELKKQFIDGATKNGFSPIEKLEKIWQDWETESHHTFNKSHAASYTLIGYQMAYLKARFPKEFTTVIKQINKQ